jgi:hypothetical protein
MTSFLELSYNAKPSGKTVLVDAECIAVVFPELNGKGSVIVLNDGDMKISVKEDTKEILAMIKQHVDTKKDET